MATQGQHTPGPWQATHSDPAEGADVWWITAGEGNNEVELGSVPGGWPRDVFEANARLIAAAPDLLEALQNLLGFGINGGMESQMAQDDARAAIAKARGEVLQPA